MARGGQQNPQDAKPLPQSIEAEQALLGVLLSDNSIFARLPQNFGIEHFAEPLHQRLFARMRQSIDKGQKTDAVLAASAFAADPAFHEMGGFSYFSDLIVNAPPPDNASHYALELVEVGARRELVKWGDTIRETAFAETADVLMAQTEAMLGELRASTMPDRLIGADEALDGVLDYIENPGSYAAGITSGLEPLDHALGPWLPGDLLVLGARPSMGKSAISAVIAQNVAASGLGVIEFHTEMSVEQAWRRRLTAMAYQIFRDEAPAYSSIRKRRLTFDQGEMLKKAREQLRGMPLKSISRGGLTLGKMRSIVRYQRDAWAKQGITLGLVTLDHAGHIVTEREHRSRVDQQSEVSGGLKRMAKEEDVPHLVLLQLNRTVDSRDDKRPLLSDLRDSGSWEQDADVVMTAYREAYYAAREREPEQGVNTKSQLAWADWSARRSSPWIEIGLPKVREGEVGAAKVWAHMPTNTILGASPPDNFFGGL